MSIISDLASLGIGMAVGEGVADALTDDDNILGHVATGVVASGLVTLVTESALRETGVDSFLDDVFGF